MFARTRYHVFVALRPVPVAALAIYHKATPRFRPMNLKFIVLDKTSVLLSVKFIRHVAKV